MSVRLLALDEDFNILGDVSLFRSLIWTRRYTRLGMYELHTSREGFALLQRGKYLYRNDADELGLIEESGYSINENGSRDAYCKGYFAEKLLADRVLDAAFHLSGNLESSMRAMTGRYAISPADPERKIPHLKLGKIEGLSQKVACQRTGASLSDALYDIGNSFGVSHRVRYDFQTNDLLFEVWQGKDRRDCQTENSWALFSDSFCNVRNAVYNKNVADYKNFAYVAGEGEGAERVIAAVDLRQAGEERRELYVDARDLSRDDGNGNATPMADYLELLRQRGREKLALCRAAETVDGGVDPHANLAYRKDFDLGDLCTYTNLEIGVTVDRRITEITETYEGGKMTLDVTFGEGGMATVRQLIKKEGATGWL